jgi:RNA polymerase sigma-70 factor (ECF subfamily)
VSEPVRIEPERLLAQTAWVRRLALSLSRDESSADDLVQDALAAALRKPPPDAASEGALQAWFAAVTRNLAIHRARGESRRGEREHAVARPEFERSQERLRELEDLRGELVKHVLTLPEESQQVVLLHFFEELDSAEIARRLGIPDSTVRNRLRRALAELRERIERRHGSDWRNLCLFVLPSAGAKVAVGGGTLAALFVVGSKLNLAASLLLLLASGWFAARPQVDPSLAASIPEQLGASALVGDQLLASAKAEDRREPAAPSARRDATLAGGLFCQGEIRSSAGGKVESARVRFRDETRVLVATDERAAGWYAVSGLSPGHYTVETEAERYRKRTFEVDLDGLKNPGRFDLTLDPTAFVQVRFVDENGKLVRMGGIARQLEQELGLSVVATSGKPPAQLPPSASGHIWFGIGHWYSGANASFHPLPFVEPGSSGALEISGDLPCFVSLVVRGRVLASQLVAHAGEVVEFPVDLPALQKERASVRLRFVDVHTKTPVADLPVQLGPSWRSGRNTNTDADGLVNFEDQPLIPLRLVYRGIERRVELHAGENDMLTIEVPALRKLRVRIIDESGKPIEGVVSWIPIATNLSAEEFDSYNSALAQAGKTTEVEAVDSRLRVTARPQYGPGAWTSVGAIVEAGAEPVELELHALRGLEIEIAWHQKPEGDRNLLFRAPDGEPCLRRYAYGEGSESVRLAPGEYSVEAWQGAQRLGTQKISIRPDTRRIELTL